MENHYKVLIVGAGTAGIMVASKLHKDKPDISIGIIDPADTHYYQPAWTLVGANTYNYDKTARPMKSLIPKGVDWIKEYASEFIPEENKLKTKEGKEFSYDFLVVCPGLVNKPELVEGLKETLNKNSVCSNYTDPKYTWECLKNFEGGVALFTQPTTPIKCGGAPQKIMYLADDYFRRSGVRKDTEVVFATPGTVIFGVPEIKKTLMEVVDRKDIYLNFGYKLVAVDGKEKIAWYEMAPHESYYNEKEIGKIKDGNRVGIKYDMMHLAPPEGPPDFIANSPLASEGGWLSVDKSSLQHTKFKNIFGLGDVAQLPSAKTGAAVRKQAPVVIANLKKMMEYDQITDMAYNGYSSCPLVTGYGKMVLAEFDYDNKFTPDPKLKQMLVFDSSKESWRLWMLKKYVLPYLYWNKMMKGIEV